MIPESMVRVERVNVFHEYLRRTILPSAIIIIEISILPKQLNVKLVMVKDANHKEQRAACFKNTSHRPE